MEPIVNPWLIYFIETIPKFLSTCFIVFLVGWIGLFVSICNFNTFDEPEENKDAINKERNMWVKRFIILIITMGTFSTILPDRDTCYKMLIASYVTTDNVKAIANQENLKAVRDGIKVDVRDIVKAVVEPVSDAVVKVQKAGDSK